MSTQTPSGRDPRHIDLATIRETITYIRDDLSDVEGLEAATAALSMALVNIEQRERAAHVAPPKISRSRFFAFKGGR